ncbi:hypothetical protein B0H19DRAFT_1374178 [Mycena capillaripes]|nr:hypothetical protein B0H19DRAFT_1374178 [Mycena capillaripes]
MRLALLLFLFLFWTTSRAGDPDVFPSEFIVPQCTALKAVWSQAPPLHLHVQPDTSITITNLVDLGLQNSTFTTWQVNLPIGQNFTFAYNTIADQFTVFQSDLMQVGPGTTDCLSESKSPTVQPPHPTTLPATSRNNAAPTTSSSTTSFVGNVPPLSSSKPTSSIASSKSVEPPPPNSTFSVTTSTSSSTIPASTTLAGSLKTVFPAGPVVGSICAVAGIIIFGLLAFIWHQRRSMKMRAYLSPDHAIFAPTVSQVSEMIRVPKSGDARSVPSTAFRGSAPQEHPKAQRIRLMRNSAPTALATEEETSGGGSIGGVEERPPAYDRR